MTNRRKEPPRISFHTDLIPFRRSGSQPASIFRLFLFAVVVFLIVILPSGCDNFPGETENTEDKIWPVDQYLITPEDDNKGMVVKFEGVVIENDLGCEIDISCVLSLKVDDYTVKVIYHYGEFPRCDNDEASIQGMSLSEGDSVEVYAGFNEEGYLSTCESQGYYLKKIH